MRALTSSLAGADAPGNVLVSCRASGLPKDSIVDVRQIVTLDKQSLTERAGKLSKRTVEIVLDGIDIVLGR